MLISWKSLFILFVIYLDAIQTVQGSHVLPRIPDDLPSTTASPTEAVSSASPSNTAHSSHITGSNDANSTSSPASSFPASTLTTSSTLFTGSVTPTLAPNASGEISSIDDGSLPLPPAITPALGLAGAFLMLSGIVYALIGIKNKTVQIFISTAYLIALAITVLIIYVIDPPISDAIQGAYFVAAFVPAVGLGGVALIFKDVTEGLGSAAGGFALSMWLLVLKPGGTLTNTAAKAAFIGCWTAGIYIIYFSHHVRSYVTIGATSFAGATAVILGIDCFSLAGLKEFWVYIWALNNRLFPPEQDTYPITRGMTVEIAGIVIFTFFGILSQLRIWKIVQNRREMKALERSDEERQRNEEETELGRQIEVEHAQERKEWERIYGDRKQDSVISTEVKSQDDRSVSMGSKEVGDATEPIAPQSAPGTLSYSGRSSVEEKDNSRQVVVPVATDDITPIVSDESQGHSPYWTNPSTSAATSVSSVARDVVKKSTKAKVEGPKVIPLPFTIPAEQNQPDEAESKSDSSLANTKHSSEVNPKKEPGIPLLRSLSNRMKRFSIMTTTSVEALADDQTAHPQTSPFRPSFSTSGGSAESIALEELDNSQTAASAQGSLGRVAEKLPVSDQGSRKSLDDTNVETNNLHWPLQSEKPSNTDLAVPLDTLDRAASAASTVLIAPSERASANASPLENPASMSEKSNENEKPDESSDKAEGPLQRVLSKDKTSKVVMQFRTNEWAKHLETAERPSPDELTATEPVVEEPVTSVDEQELLKTALTAQPAPAPIHAYPAQMAATSQASPVYSSTRSNSKNKHLKGTSNAMSQASVSKSRPDVLRSVSSSGRIGSKRTSMRESKRQSQLSPFQASRGSLLASPITEDVVASFPAGPSPSPQNANSPRRPHKVPHRSVTDPLSNSVYRSSQPSLGPQAISSDTEVATALSNENLPLSQRRSFLRQSSGGKSPANVAAGSSIDVNSRATSKSPRTSQPSIPQAQYPQEQQAQQIVPEHTLHRASMLADWRRSKATELHKSTSQTHNTSPANATSPYLPAADPGLSTNNGPWTHSSGAIRGSWNQLGGTGMSSPPPNIGVGKGMVDSAIYSGRNRLSRRSSGMSAREVDNAHREVLRRMQAGANKALARDDR